MAPDPNATDPAAAEADARAAHEADRGPTADEAREADEQADRVDPASGQHFHEMAERGAAVRGEGEIVPE